MTIEQSRLASTEVINPTHKRTRLSKAGAAAAISLVPFDVAISDSAFYRGQQALNHLAENWHLSQAAEWLFSRGTTFGIISAQALMLGGLVRASKGAREAYEGFYEYTEARKQELSGIKKVASTVVNSPITLLNKMGNGFEKISERFKKTDSKVAQQIGQTVLDTGRTNSMSTTGAILDEGEMTMGRMARIVATFGLSWDLTTDSIREFYGGVGKLGVPGEVVQRGLGIVGRTAYELTAVGLPNPLETPVATAFMGSVLAACAITGAHAVDFMDARKANTNPEPVENMAQVIPFPAQPTEYPPVA